MTQILDGKKLAQKFEDNIRKEIEAKNLDLTLAMVLVGDNEASNIYVSKKREACARVGIKSKDILLANDTSEEELLGIIDKLNNDPSVSGILVQLPLPKHMSYEKVLNAIDPTKDVDGFHPVNVGNLYLDLPCLLPCTPAGMMALLKEYKIDCQGKHAVVVGASNIVGKPMSILLLQAKATVTICHEHTKDLKTLTKQADILISAVGKKHLITADMLKDNVVVLDVGISREDGTIYGDVDFENVIDKAQAITPVPGGVGPMTIAILLKNCLEALKK